MLDLFKYYIKHFKFVFFLIPISICLMALCLIKTNEYAILKDTVFTYKDMDKDSILVTVTFKVVNGAWNNGNAADKTVTLTGLEGDTLKLAATDIPAVGSKPNDTYKAGSWDVKSKSTMSQDW